MPDVVMIGNWAGENGQTWRNGLTYPASDSFATMLINAGRAHDAAGLPSALSAASIAATQALVSAAGNHGASGFVVMSPTAPRLPRCTSQVNITGGTAGVAYTYVTIDDEQWLQCTATALATTTGTSTSFNLNFDVPALAYPVNCDSVTIECIAPSPQGSPYQVSLGTAGNYTIQSSNAPWSIGSPSGSDPLCMPGAKTVVNLHRTGVNLAATGYAGESILQPFDVCSLRVNFATTLSAGTVLTFFIRSFVLGGAGRKGRLAIIADDGYANWFQRGVPIMQRYGIKTTAAIIVDKSVGGLSTNALFAREQALADYVQAGNFCVAHGPSAADGPSNLFLGSLAGSGPTFTAARVEDMKYASNWLLSRGYTNARGAACYVWPQGWFNTGDGNSDLLNAAYEAGYRLCRGAIPYPNCANVISASNYERFCNFRAISKNNRWRMVAPIIGHAYVGAANTPDDANETAAIARLVLVIQNLAASGMDGILMLHQVVSKGQASSTIHIEVDRLVTLAAAIQTLVNAGTLECVGMPELIDPQHLA